MKRSHAIATYFCLAAMILSLDLWTKDAVFDFLQVNLIHDGNGQPILDRHPEHAVFAGWLSLEAAINYGAFSGWFATLPSLLIVVSLVALSITLCIVALPARSSPFIVCALGLLAGGALGNLYDRFTHGAVRDFIKVYYKAHIWPNFNLADSAICTGVALLLLRELLVWRNARRHAPAEQVI